MLLRRSSPSVRSGNHLHVTLSDLWGIIASVSVRGSFLSVDLQTPKRSEHIQHVLSPVVEVDLLPGGEVIHQRACHQAYSWDMISQKSEQEEDLFLRVFVIEG